MSSKMVLPGKSLTRSRSHIAAVACGQDCSVCFKFRIICEVYRWATVTEHNKDDESLNQSNGNRSGKRDEKNTEEGRTLGLVSDEIQG